MFEKKDPGKSPRDTNGPVVKTGPTAGQNRSRNKDGSWRDKRSDAGTSRKKDEKSGCFLTTAACQYQGLPDDCRQLQILRRFRDEYLAQTPEGVELIHEYYRKAPTIVARLNDQDLDQIWIVIEQCVKLIDAQKPSEAKAIYIKMIHQLRIQFDTTSC